MKLNRTGILAVALLIGAFAVTGCKKKVDAGDEDTAGDSPAAADTTAPADEEPSAPTSPGVTQTDEGEKLDHPAPPALREETPGDPPAPAQVWQRGYWRWDTGRSLYVWIAGFWADPTAAPTRPPPALRIEDQGFAPGPGYFYAPGFWRWTGSTYVWRYGHWDARRAGVEYVRPGWDRVGGRWTYRPGGWGGGDGRRGGAGDGRRPGGGGDGHREGSHAGGEPQGGGHGSQTPGGPATVAPATGGTPGGHGSSGGASGGHGSSGGAAGGHTSSGGGHGTPPASTGHVNIPKHR